MPSLAIDTPAASPEIVRRPFPRPATSRNEEVIFLTEALPTPILQLWHTVKDFEGLFREGGLNLPANVVKNAFKSIQDGARGWAKDRFSTKTYYCPDGNNKTFNCPRWQLKNQRIETHIEEGYFENFELNFLKEYLVSSGDQDEKTAAGDLSTSLAGDEAARGTGEQGNASTAGAPSTSTAGTTLLEALQHASAPGAHPTSTGDRGPATGEQVNEGGRSSTAQPGAGWANGEFHRACSDPGCSVDHSRDAIVVDTPSPHQPKSRQADRPTRPVTEDGMSIRKAKGSIAYLPIANKTPKGEAIGLCFAQLGLQSQCIQIGEEHARQCKEGRLYIEADGRMHRGFQVEEIHRCNVCSFRRKVKYASSAAVSTSKRKRGAAPDHLGERIIHAAHGAGVNSTQVGELLDQAGVVRLSDTGIQGITKRRKAIVKEVAEEQLKQNRIDHNNAVRALHGTTRDVYFTDTWGITHTFTAGPLSSDGAGETRAYQHRITGKQHCTVVFSVLIDKPLAIKHHQISTQDITAEDLEHPGVCSRNTTLSPAQAEEPALEELGEYLLIDPATGKFRPDDEAILALELVTDGDTKGAKRFMAKQAELVPVFAGKAEQFPDLGHFIKAISTAFHKLKENNSDLRGKELLESVRIKVMCSDVAREIRQYGSKRKELDLSAPDHEEKLDELRKGAIKGVGSVIPHHCGDHSKCNLDCKYRQIENEYIEKFSKDPPGRPRPEQRGRQILAMYEIQIKSDYSKVARFKGKVMSMGEKGQGKIYNEITKRLNEKNIDRVAEAFSSISSAGKKSDNRFEDQLQQRAGIQDTYLRQVQVVKTIKKKRKKREHDEKQQTKERRKCSQLTKLKDGEKSLKCKGRHMSNKLDAMDNCKISIEQPQKKKAAQKRRKCSNCGEYGHTKAQCGYPAGMAPKKPKAKGKRQTKKDKEREEMMNTFANSDFLLD
ncbi:hypothetical protein THAOC_03416 [Thalassiosira oceanica]|uniref:CCHC-type domain-containing protein n=1 Tax=Thalassiosira oceanica TaxID=159749 RepID=K0TBK0_THAOC|nr:hypothetical protein THAOC_03416 [Thalassiosira oceanica]|eukprot:EJK74880.1 hypothetical protein THAOC_03416 [Thalassiosira oceanica]